MSTQLIPVKGILNRNRTGLASLSVFSFKTKPFFPGTVWLSALELPFQRASAFSICWYYKQKNLLLIPYSLTYRIRNRIQMKNQKEKKKLLLFLPFNDCQLFNLLTMPYITFHTMLIENPKYVSETKSWNPTYPSSLYSNSKDFPQSDFYFQVISWESW